MLKTSLKYVPRQNLNSFLAVIWLPGAGQPLNRRDQEVIHQLEAHVKYLAGDALEGRRAGTPGERLAMQYISTQFEKNGLAPKGENGGYDQPFPISDGRSYQKNSYLTINGDAIAAGNFFPAPLSPETTIEASPSIALKEPGVPWFLDVKEDWQNAAANPHFNKLRYLSAQALEAAKKGATALFVYNTDAHAADEQYNAQEKAEPAAIPVIMVAKGTAQQYFRDETATLSVRLHIRYSNDTRTGHNVAAYLDNGAAATVIIGAHYDHLGFGEDGGSLLRTGEKQVHNGADDNASGVAALIELSALLKHSRLKKNNYLFIAFSGEELGLFGSKYFTEHPTVNLLQVNYMINMDMIGRLGDSAKTLTIGGYGTSPAWPKLLANSATGKYITNRYDSSGSGPSDHTSFYRKGIPVLFFFTGLHADYHKPTDDADKINYTGEYRIVQYVYKIVDAANKSGKLAFTSTREGTTGMAASFSVTLGIMPDYSYSGAGVRIDGISDGRPAQKAGLRPGDVVVQLGDYPVTSLESYMQALNKFKPGESTRVTIKRPDGTVEKPVTF